MLPRVDYFSKLDKYVLMCMGFLALLIAAHCLVQLADDNPATLQLLEMIAGADADDGVAGAVAIGDGGRGPSEGGVGRHEAMLRFVDAKACKWLASSWAVLNTFALLFAVRLHIARIHKGVVGDNEDEIDEEEEYDGKLQNETHHEQRSWPIVRDI